MDSFGRAVRCAAVSAAVVGSTACATTHRAPPVVAPLVIAPPSVVPAVAPVSPVLTVAAASGTSFADEFAVAIEGRIAELKARGGDCEEFGAVLENALASGRITIRPYMWRVDGNLASAQGESSGELTIARDIDSLNVGVRRVDDVVRSAEHEAAHIALRIPSGDRSREARVDERVNSCRGGMRR